MSPNSHKWPDAAMLFRGLCEFASATAISEISHAFAQADSTASRRSAPAEARDRAQRSCGAATFAVRSQFDGALFGFISPELAEVSPPVGHLSGLARPRTC